MHVEQIDLDQFRSFEHVSLSLPPAGLRIAGRNGSGKTTLLEALVVLSTTRSPRTQTDREVVAWDSGLDYGIAAYSRIQAEVQTIRGQRIVSVGIELDESRPGTSRRTYEINGERRRAQDLVGELTCVLFSPEDVILVPGAPSLRRREIDILISQTDRPYMRALSSYGRILAQRNQLLRHFAKARRSPRDGAAVNEISFWDEQLVASGSIVLGYRTIVAAQLAKSVSERSKTLIQGAEVGLDYQPRVDLAGVSDSENVETLVSQVAHRFERQLEVQRENEFRRGQSLVGPHRDDFPFTIEGRELSAYGSRGQQRLGVVAFKMACIDVIRQRTNDQPVLLLDDVLSELDIHHRELLLHELAQCGCQVVVTSTDRDLLDEPVLAALPLMEVGEGSLKLAV